MNDSSFFFLFLEFHVGVVLPKHVLLALRVRVSSLPPSRQNLVRVILRIQRDAVAARDAGFVAIACRMTDGEESFEWRETAYDDGWSLGGGMCQHDG